MEQVPDWGTVTVMKATETWCRNGRSYSPRPSPSQQESREDKRSDRLAKQGFRGKKEYQLWLA
ncbi:MAG: hypothetical protein NNA18_01770 [Nitrospira sp.]|nr:hypothetical protein [Nitrospira sp.]